MALAVLIGILMYSKSFLLPNNGFHHIFAVVLDKRFNFPIYGIWCSHIYHNERIGITWDCTLSEHMGQNWEYISNSNAITLNGL